MLRSDGSIRLGQIKALPKARHLLCIVALSFWSAMSFADVDSSPSPEANCVVTAMNRSAPLQSDYSFTLTNLPRTGTQPFRVRATYSDGIVGETEVAFPLTDDLVTYMGDIFWRPATPIPLGLLLNSDASHFQAGTTAQLTVNGVSALGSLFDLTARIKGTQYNSSNSQLVSVSENGQVAVRADFSPIASSRVVMTAQNEGVAGSTVLVLGPQGRLMGRVVQADGATPVSGAQVTVLRLSPREVVGTVLTDASGNYSFENVSAGSFSVAVVDPTTADRGRGVGAITTNGETQAINVRLNGQGTVTVNVLSAAGAPIANALVSFSSLSGFNDSRQLQTNANGSVIFERALASDFVISARDTATGLVGGGSGKLAAGGSMTLIVTLQPVGAIAGAVYGTDGASVQAGVQVRLLSAAHGLVSQFVTGEDGRFRFDTLPLADGPYVLFCI